MDTTRRVSFIDQQLAISKEGEPIHDGDGDEENTDSTTCRVSLNDQELAIPEESEPIDDDDRYEESINSTTYHHSFNQELTIPKETEPVHYDGPDEESSQRSWPSYMHGGFGLGFLLQIKTQSILDIRVHISVCII